MVLQDHLTIKNHYISTTTVSMAIKFGRMVTNLKMLLATTLFYPLVTWSCDIT